LFNTKIQGTCSHWMQFSIRNFVRDYIEARMPDVQFWFNVHDAAYFEHPPELYEDVCHCFNEAVQAYVRPLGCDYLKVDSEMYPERWGYK
jgi:DNA polymerase I-like protein with 3'-5' exonuclease and polymerase domains